MQPSPFARRHALALVVALTTAACGADETATGEAPIDRAPDACAQAAAHLATCFPEQPAASTCDAATAARVAATPCETLAEHDGKADNAWLCLWTPWLCAGPGPDGPPTGTRTVTVGVERCGGSILDPDGCDGVYGAPCSLVVLADAAGAEVARAYTGTYGSVRFEGVGAGAHTARVLDRAGATAAAVFGDFSPEVGPAEVAVPEGADDLRVNLYLRADSEATVKACSTVSGYLDVVDAAGERLAAEDIEWGWFVRFLAADGTVEVKRPFRLHPEASPTGAWENTFALHAVYAGAHVVEFIEMDIPEWARENNPDYEALLRRYAVDSVPVEALELTVDAADVPEDLSFRHLLQR